MKYLNYFYKLYFCLIIISLLWITTLNLSFSIIKETISSPYYLYTYQICHNTLNNILYQKDNFKKCSNLQYKQCKKNYYFNLLNEIERSNNIIKQNNQIQINSTLHYNSCQNYFYQTIDSLNAWKDQILINKTLEYQSISFKPSCSLNNRLKVTNLLSTNGESTSTSTTSSTSSLSNSDKNSPTKLKRKNIHDANNLFKYTSKLLQSLGSYSEEITKYNIDYINNHTSITPIKASLLIKKISTPYLNTLLKHEIQTINKKISTIMNSLIACVSLNPSLLRNCTLISTSVLSQYLKTQSIINGNLQYIHNEFILVARTISNYGKTVVAALKAADNFYDVMSGIMQWIQINLVPLSPHTINLCSIQSNSMSWCDFTKV